jgi:hypothetical protein
LSGLYLSPITTHTTPATSASAAPGAQQRQPWVPDGRPPVSGVRGRRTSPPVTRRVFWAAPRHLPRQMPKIPGLVRRNHPATPGTHGPACGDSVRRMRRPGRRPAGFTHLPLIRYLLPRSQRKGRELALRCLPVSRLRMNARPPPAQNRPRDAQTRRPWPQPADQSENRHALASNSSTARFSLVSRAVNHRTQTGKAAGGSRRSLYGFSGPASTLSLERRVGGRSSLQPAATMR